MQITGIKCQLITECRDHTLRLSSIINTPISLCGCDASSAFHSFGCCNVLDLGVIYEVVPEYTANNPCAPSRYDTIVYPEGEEAQCVIVPDPEPYGTILEYKRMAARMVVWRNASISNGVLNYEERNLYYSRQRKDLPQIIQDQCINPIYCPAENGLYTCCQNESRSTVGGGYTNCTVNIFNNCTLECNSNFRPQVYKYGMSNCLLTYEEDGSGTKDVILSGYAECPEWWFVDDGNINDLEQTIAQNSPFFGKTLTIYAHFQIEWKPINCNNKGGLPFAPCNGIGVINLINGRCGCHHTQGLTDEEERKRAVRIKAAIGYSTTSCGFELDTACEKIYE